MQLFSPFYVFCTVPLIMSTFSNFWAFSDVLENVEIQQDGGSKMALF